MRNDIPRRKSYRRPNPYSSIGAGVSQIIACSDLIRLLNGKAESDIQLILRIVGKSTFHIQLSWRIQPSELNLPDRLLPQFGRKWPSAFGSRSKPI